LVLIGPRAALPFVPWNQGVLSAAFINSGHHYNKDDAKFTKEYKWQHCKDMKVGETYEVHWPHSAAGMCGTPFQYQTPFYDGVLCNSAAVTATLAAQASNPSALPSAVGVQSQVFTIVNDEDYYYPDLIRGMIVDGDYGTHMTKYTGCIGTVEANMQFMLSMR